MLGKKLTEVDTQDLSIANNSMNVKKENTRSFKMGFCKSQLNTELILFDTFGNLLKKSPSPKDTMENIIK